MAGFHVFTSYAQANREKHLEKFIDEFSEQVGSLLGLADRTTIVFFDRNGVKAGDEWSPTIIDALRHAKILVCLMSPTYLGREWCGRELEMFLGRLGKLHLPEGTSAHFIFPIWWQMPVSPRPLPAKLCKWHHRDAGFPPRYEALGVKGLARKALWQQFRVMADRLAELIVLTLNGDHHLPSGDPIADITEIANAFDEQQELDVRLLALAPGGDAWQPGATDLTISKAAAQCAKRLQIFIRPLEMAAGIVAGIEKAQAEKQLVLLVVDSTSTPDTVLNEVNGLNLPNLSLLLVQTNSGSIGPDGWLSNLPAGAFHRQGMLDS